MQFFIIMIEIDTSDYFGGQFQFTFYFGFLISHGSKLLIINFIFRAFRTGNAQLFERCVGNKHREASHLQLTLNIYRMQLIYN